MSQDVVELPGDLHAFLADPAQRLLLAGSLFLGGSFLHSADVVGPASGDLPEQERHRQPAQEPQGAAPRYQMAQIHRQVGRQEQAESDQQARQRRPTAVGGGHRENADPHRQGVEAAWVSQARVNQSHEDRRPHHGDGPSTPEGQGGRRRDQQGPSQCVR